jgi:hypothetical protein
MVEASADQLKNGAVKEDFAKNHFLTNVEGSCVEDTTKYSRL